MSAIGLQHSIVNAAILNDAGWYDVLHDKVLRLGTLSK